jgi:hypothetical protein
VRLDSIAGASDFWQATHDRRVKIQPKEKETNYSKISSTSLHVFRETRVLSAGATQIYFRIRAWYPSNWTFSSNVKCIFTDKSRNLFL